MIELEDALSDPIIKKAFSDAGWTPTYNYDPSPWVNVLTLDGYSILPIAREIWESFGGLIVIPPVREEAAFRSGAVVFDPVFAARGEAPRIKERELSIGTKLCPIGEWSGEYILLVSPDGAVVAETTDETLFVGRNIADAFRCIIRADRLPSRIYGG